MQTSSPSSSIQTAHLADWIGTAILLPVCAHYVFRRFDITILDSLCMLVFDAGRLAFEVVGPALAHLGGAAVLVLLPLLLIWYFSSHGYCLGIQVFMFWLGQNLIFLSRTVAATEGRHSSLLNRYEFDMHVLMSYLQLEHSIVLIEHTLFMLGIAIFLVLLVLPLYVRR